MNISDRKGLKAQARQSLANAKCDVRKIVLIYCAVGAGVPFLLDVLSTLVASLSPSTGGLSGMGTQSLFDTVVSLLSSLPSILLPFWGVGFTFASMGFLRRETVTTSDLTVGFRRFWPFLRLTILQSLIFMGLVMLATYLSVMIAMPFSDNLAALLEEAIAATPVTDIEALFATIPITKLLPALVPMLLILIAALLILLVPMYYRMSLTSYVLLEAPDLGAIAAISFSRRFTKGSCWQLFRLDLSFWWYHLLTFLAGMVSLSPMLLTPILQLSPTVLALLCSFLSAALSFVLNVKFLPLIGTTYAAAFEALRDVHLKPALPEQEDGE